MVLAKKIESLSYSEANEMANFGRIFYTETIIPLIRKNIPLRILNTFNQNNGTLILQILMHQVLKRHFRKRVFGKS
jgi:aspartokinase